MIAGDISPDTLWERARPLRPALPNSSLIPAFYDLQRKENQLMVRWILEPEIGDVRFNLAHLLFSKEVEDHYDVVIFDCPPRLSTATIAALGASKHLVVPTGVDGLSLDAVKTFLGHLRKLKPQINPSISLAGVVLSLTQERELTPAESKRVETLKDLSVIWGGPVHTFARNIPRIAPIANVAGRDFAYNTDDRAKAYFTELGDELCQQIGYERPAKMVAAQ
jgi:cellulose biosynthesis protein BcsQ